MRSKELERFFISDFRWLVNCEALLESEFFNRREAEFMAASGGTVGLRPDGYDLVPVFQAAPQ